MINASHGDAFSSHLDRCRIVHVHGNFVCSLVSQRQGAQSIKNVVQQSFSDDQRGVVCYLGAVAHRESGPSFCDSERHDNPPDRFAVDSQRSPTPAVGATDDLKMPKLAKVSNRTSRTVLAEN